MLGRVRMAEDDNSDGESRPTEELTGLREQVNALKRLETDLKHQLATLEGQLDAQATSFDDERQVTGVASGDLPSEGGNF